MKMSSLRALATSLFLAGFTAFAGSVMANTGIQVPLSQYQAGAVTTTPNSVLNPDFESVTTGVPNNWTPMGNMQVAAPINPAPASAGSDGNFAAQMLANQLTSTDPEQYRQLDPVNSGARVFKFTSGQTYQLSAFMWNFGRPDPTGPLDFITGDLVLAELDDVDDPTHNVNVTLERFATDGGDGANGYFVSNTFDGGIFPDGATLDVRGDLNENLTDAIPDVYGQIDNVAITPIPEPGSLVLLGASGLLSLRRRK